MGNVFFITGTDTGVGKTTLTALLLLHLRRRGIHALAIKPFCSGSRRDVRLLSAAQDGELPDALINPYHFRKPVAPAACELDCGIELPDVVERIQAVQERCQTLLVEGAGGLMVPLTKSFLIADLIAALDVPAIVVAANKLGVINHTVLTIDALQARRIAIQKVALMDQPRRDASASSNHEIILQTRPFADVIRVPYLGQDAGRFRALKKIEKKIQKTIAQVLEPDTFCASSERRVNRPLQIEAR